MQTPRKIANFEAYLLTKATIMKDNDWKQRLNIVYSTNPDMQYETDEVEEEQ